MSHLEVAVLLSPLAFTLFQGLSRLWVRQFGGRADFLLPFIRSVTPNRARNPVTPSLILHTCSRPLTRSTLQLHGLLLDFGIFHALAFLAQATHSRPTGKVCTTTCDEDIREPGTGLRAAEKTNFV